MKTKFDVGDCILVWRNIEKDSVALIRGIIEKVKIIRELDTFGTINITIIYTTNNFACDEKDVVNEKKIEIDNEIDLADFLLEKLICKDVRRKNE